VEDNANDAELAIRELKKHNMANNLFHVKDGEEALEFIFANGRFSNERKHPVPTQVVLLDIQNAQNKRHWGIAENKKADERTKATPVVMLTSSKEDPTSKNVMTWAPIVIS